MASEPPRDALAELRSTRDDFSQFFGDVFDQLQTLSLEMFARHKSLETAAHLTTGVTDAEPASVLNSQVKHEIERCLEELKRTHATLLAQGNHWQQTHADLGAARRQISDELAEVQAIRRQVAEMAGQFTEIKTELWHNHNALAALSERVEQQLSLLRTLTVNSHGSATANGPPEQLRERAG